MSYVPEDKNWNGQFRRIKITVGPSGYTLAYRRGYFAEDPDGLKSHERIAIEPMQSTMLRAAPSSSQILFKILVLPADELPSSLPAAASNAAVQPVKGPSRNYVLDFSITAADLAFSETPDGVRHGTVEYAAVAYDIDGNVLNSISGRLNGNLKPATFQRVSVSGIPLHQTIQLPLGTVFLRVGLHDPATDKVGSLEIPLHVTALQPATSSASPSPAVQPSAMPR